MSSPWTSTTETLVLDWLMGGDPSIRWQTMRDLTGQPNATERARVAHEGWGARLLDLQADDGHWGGGAYSPKWTSTTYTLLQLRHLGVLPEDRRVEEAVAKVRRGVVMGAGSQPFFSYRGETCITGMVLALGAYYAADPAVTAAVADWVLEEQLPDGGWNCQSAAGSHRASFHTTISVLEGLVELRRGDPEAGVDDAIRLGNEYLLARRMYRRLSTGEPVSPRWTLFSFPPRWHYDVLRGLDHLRDAGAPPDPRCGEAIALVEKKRTADGRWPLQNHHKGREHFQIEDGPGKPSRWNTLRALRVLAWNATASATSLRRDIEPQRPGTRREASPDDLRGR